MKLKNTLILLLIAGAVFAFIRFYEDKIPTTKESQERSGRVVQFDRDKIDAITIKNTETTIELRKQKDGNWMMEKPLKDRADSMVVNQLFTAAEALKSDEAITVEKSGKKDQMKEFGLANSETRLTFGGGAKPVELSFGKDAAVEGKLYVRLEGTNIAHVTGNDLRTQITKKPDDFRDHKLSEVTTTQVNKVTVKSSAGEIELGRKDQHWSLAKPLKARGNDQKVNDLISQVANARVDSFVTDSSNLTTFGLQEPRGTVTLSAEGKETPTTLLIGQAHEKEKDKIYVKISSRDAVCVVPKTIESVLSTTPNDLRDRNLMRVEADIVDRITIEAASKDKIVLARSGEIWVRKAGDKDQAINAASATRLLSELQSQQVANFVADVATELPKYGLDQPQLKVTLSSYASENTAETKAGEKPIVTVLFGNVEGDNVFAKLDDEPFVVSVPKAMLDFAMSDPLQWQELTIYKFKPEEIQSIEIAREGQPPVELERDKEKKWIVSKGDGKANATNADSLVNTLAALRAVRWAGATQPEQGMEKPVMTVTFKTVNKAGGKLTIGTLTPDELSYATTDALTGTFALSRPDVTAFELPLTDKPAPPPAAAVAPPAAAVGAPALQPMPAVLPGASSQPIAAPTLPTNVPVPNAPESVAPAPRPDAPAIPPPSPLPPPTPAPPAETPSPVPAAAAPGTSDASAPKPAAESTKPAAAAENPAPN